MAVLQTTVWRVRPGMTQGFLANVATAKKILERLGAQRVRAVNQMVGARGAAEGCRWAIQHASSREPPQRADARASATPAL